MKTIGIIDCNYGNIRSVFQAFEYLDTAPKILKDPEKIKSFDALILPGVGTFEKCMIELRQSGWDSALHDFVKQGKSILGICVGMQVFMDKGYEFGEHSGLGLIAGECHSLARFRSDDRHAPHIGWAEVAFKNLGSKSAPYRDFFYFNHSYVCVPTDMDCVKATAMHEKTWPVLIQKDTVSGIQCHPEKSHRAGLAFLQQFLDNMA